MSQALIDSGISHEEFARIIEEKNKYEGIKENIENLKDIEDIEDTKNDNYEHMYKKWSLVLKII